MPCLFEIRLDSADGSLFQRWFDKMVELKASAPLGGLVNRRALLSHHTDEVTVQLLASANLNVRSRRHVIVNRVTQVSLQGEHGPIWGRIIHEYYPDADIPEN